MSEQTHLQTELEAWCQSYVIAFEAFDLHTISNHWAFPAMIVSGARQLVMKDKASFDHNTGALIAFYERHNAKRVTRTIVDAQALIGGTALMRVQDEISTPDGTLITTWRSAYILRKTADGWRAIFADATGEAEAWAARGTPLGGSR